MLPSPTPVSSFARSDSSLARSDSSLARSGFIINALFLRFDGMRRAFAQFANYDQKKIVRKFASEAANGA